MRPLLQQGGLKQVTGSLAHSLPEEGQAGSLCGVRVGVCPRVGLEGWLSCFAHPLGGVECRGHEQYPAFAPDLLFLLPALQKRQLGVFFFFFFGLFVSFFPEFSPTVYARSYF